MADAAAGKRILVTDDDPEIRTSLALALRSQGYQVDTACDGNDAIAKCEEHVPDLVMCDIFMPNKDGLDTMRELRQKHPHVKLIAFSGGGEYKLTTPLLIAKHMGADRILTKPISMDELVTTVSELLAS